MYDIALILGIGVPTGIILALLHHKHFGSSVKNLEISSGRNNNSQSSKNNYDNRDIPSSWDGNSHLLLCANCDTLNKSYSRYCRRCTGDLNISEKIDKGKIQIGDGTNGH